jgi:exodeoxyribonuclease VII large subunit
MLTKMQPGALSNIAEYTVSELSFAIKRTVEDAFGLVRLRGEISGYRGVHSSGHAYLSLKDERARIDAVIWKSTFSGLKFKPEEGLEVIVTGRVTTFPGKSGYQIIIEQLEPAGAGALMALLEERKKKFAAEGLFDQSRKRLLPFWPQIVGIVTSPTGAVIRDMLHGFEERCPTRVIVWPVRVQGETCAEEVARAIRGFNAFDGTGPIPRPELIIVARGGGSLEDLWGFNEEIAVRAAAESQIPLISAVGHETDWTLIDLVADARAPTPTKAAEWAVPKHGDLVIRLGECTERVRRCVRRNLEGLRAELRGAERGLPRPSSLLAIPRQRLDTASLRLAQSLRHFAQHARGRFDRCAVRLTNRLIFDRTRRHGELLTALNRHAVQAFRSVVHKKQRGFETCAVRLSPRLARAPIDKAADRLERMAGVIIRAFEQTLAKKRARFDDRAARLNPVLLAVPGARRRERLEGLVHRAVQGYAAGLGRMRGRLETLAPLLRSLSHKSVLERGFALVRDSDGKMVRRAAALEERAASLEIEFADGRIQTHYSGVRRELAQTAARQKGFAPAVNKRAAAVKADDGSQGSLL